MKIVGILRFIGLVFLIIRCIVPIYIRSFFKKNDIWYGLKQRQKMSASLMKLLGIDLKVTGQPQQGTYLYVSNHQSYIDPAIISKHIMALTITKAEVEKWPLIGLGLKLTGNLFVKRESRKSRMEVLHGLRDCLNVGLPILLFPEGTTSTCDTTLLFQLGGFSIAADLGIGVVPIAVKYGSAADCFVGNETFNAHFLRCFSKPNSKAYAWFGEPIFDSDSKLLKDKVKETIDDHLAQLK
jgi:1-acyl-sn-glycerol-3-phosphate acyltransferase